MRLRSRIWPAVAAALFFACGARAIAAQEAFDLFFLAVGSTDYVAADDEGLREFERIRGANASAERITELLLRGGARFGVTLTSSRDHLVSKADIDEALTRVLAEAKGADPGKAFIVYYFAGHGLSEGIGWNQEPAGEIRTGR